MAQKWQVEEQTQNANKDNSNTADLTSLSVEETAPEEPTILSRVKLVFGLFLMGVTIPATPPIIERRDVGRRPLIRTSCFQNSKIGQGKWGFGLFF